MKKANPRTPFPLPDLRGEDHRPYLESFWRLVDQSGGPTACWPWTGPRYLKERPHPDGYGFTHFNGRRMLVHRLAYAAVNGVVPAGPS
jgi:hypothetical protein